MPLVAKMEDLESAKYYTIKFSLLILGNGKQIGLVPVRLGNANEKLLNFLLPRQALLFNADNSADRTLF